MKGLSKMKEREEDLSRMKEQEGRERTAGETKNID
jgi:hypothetical protein